MAIHINDSQVKDAYSNNISYNWNTGGYSPRTYTIKVNAVGSSNVGKKTVQVIHLTVLAPRLDNGGWLGLTVPGSHRLYS
jgi:hypothetical protein